jgi:hypothetical protein
MYSVMFTSVRYSVGSEWKCLLTFSSFVVIKMKHILDALINFILLAVNMYPLARKRCYAIIWNISDV